ncbi:MAG TPA: methyltransferase domain-containing protein [Nitrososphaeraceae archaeon]
MRLINPINVLLWGIRRNQRDVINLYSSLSPLMSSTTGSYMLNFGYWSDGIDNPVEAQENLCNIIGKLAELESAKTLVDVGSGLSSPAIFWKNEYPLLEIYCININHPHLIFANRLKEQFFIQKNLNKKFISDISLFNSTAIKLPFNKESIDRIIALESAQHFKPLIEFIKDVKYILKKDGIFVIAIPVITNLLSPIQNLVKLGILSFTWASEHYVLNDILEILKFENFKIIEILNIGQLVYTPLSEYYIKNRKILLKKITSEYGSFLEYILFKSLVKMDKLSKEKIIDYIIIKLRKI